MSLTLVTPPAEEPVSLEEMIDPEKGFLRTVPGEEEPAIASYLLAARQHLEWAITGLAFLTQTWDYAIDAFPFQSYGPSSLGMWGTNYYPQSTVVDPYGSIYLPRPPLQSVTSITYVDFNGATQTLASSRYTVDIMSRPGRVTMNYADFWPVTRAVPNAVIVRFVAGWATPEEVPEAIRQAIKIQAATLYEHREELAANTTFDELPVVKRLLAEHRMYALI